MAETVQSQLEKRATKTQLVLAYFKSKPNQWIDVHELAHVGGFAAWRTRVSEARAIVHEEGGDIIWNQQTDSKYLYRPHKAIGRDASERLEQKGLFG